MPRLHWNLTLLLAGFVKVGIRKERFLHIDLDLVQGRFNDVATFFNIFYRYLLTIAIDLLKYEYIQDHLDTKLHPQTLNNVSPKVADYAWSFNDWFLVVHSQEEALVTSPDLIKRVYTGPFGQHPGVNSHCFPNYLTPELLLERRLQRSVRFFQMRMPEFAPEVNYIPN